MASRKQAFGPFVWVVCSFVVFAPLGCGSNDPLASAGVVVRPPVKWVPLVGVETNLPQLPRRTIAAWFGPGRSILQVHVDITAPGTNPESLAKDLSTRLANMPQLEILSCKVETIAGQSTVRFEAVAPGTGDAWAPSGTGEPKTKGGSPLSPTHRTSVGFARDADTIWLTWHYPESAAANVKPEIEKTLGSLVVRNHKSSVSSY